MVSMVLVFSVSWATDVPPGSLRFSSVLFFQGSFFLHHQFASIVSPGRLLLRAAPVFDISVCFWVTGWSLLLQLRVFGRHSGFSDNVFLGIWGLLHLILILFVPAGFFSGFCVNFTGRCGSWQSPHKSALVRLFSSVGTDSCCAHAATTHYGAAWRPALLPFQSLYYYLLCFPGGNLRTVYYGTRTAVNFSYREDRGLLNFV
jgi:hypothetical protein